MQHRIHVIFRGNVHGVGFRYTARRTAQKYSLGGFVKNLTDGTVEVVAEGNQAQIAQFIDELEHDMARFIQAQTIDWTGPTGEFTGFTVRF